MFEFLNENKNGFGRDVSVLLQGPHLGSTNFQTLARIEN